MIGHGLGAAGALEAIATIKAINTGWLHPTINQDVCTIILVSLTRVMLHISLLQYFLMLFMFCITQPCRILSLMLQLTLFPM
jgi:hypothetical protein